VQRTIVNIKKWVRQFSLQHPLPRSSSLITGKSDATKKRKADEAGVVPGGANSVGNPPFLEEFGRLQGTFSFWKNNVKGRANLMDKAMDEAGRKEANTTPAEVDDLFEMLKTSLCFLLKMNFVLTSQHSGCILWIIGYERIPQRLGQTRFISGFNFSVINRSVKYTKDD
jgi:hypothetical protein